MKSWPVCGLSSLGTGTSDSGFPGQVRKKARARAEPGCPPTSAAAYPPRSRKRRGDVSARPLAALPDAGAGCGVSAGGSPAAITPGGRGPGAGWCRVPALSARGADGSGSTPGRAPRRGQLLAGVGLPPGPAKQPKCAKTHSPRTAGAGSRTSERIWLQGDPKALRSSRGDRHLLGCRRSQDRSPGREAACPASAPTFTCLLCALNKTRAPVCSGAAQVTPARESACLPGELWRADRGAQHHLAVPLAGHTLCSEPLSLRCRGPSSRSCPTSLPKVRPPRALLYIAIDLGNRTQTHGSPSGRYRGRPVSPGARVDTRPGVAGTVAQNGNRVWQTAGQLYPGYPCRLGAPGGPSGQLRPGPNLQGGHGEGAGPQGVRPQGASASRGEVGST